MPITSFIPTVLLKNIPSETKKICRSHLFRLRYAFKTFDRDKNGSVDFEEFLLSMAARSRKSLEKRLNAAFDV